MITLTKPTSRSSRRPFFDFVFKIVAWLQTVASPFFAGMIIGLLMYTQFPASTTLFIALFTTLTGLVIGVSWATKIWTKEGTLQFMSRVIESVKFEKN